MKAADKQKVLAALFTTIKASATPVCWTELMTAVNATGVKVKNWLEVRNILQWLMDEKVIARCNDTSDSYHV